MKEKIICILTLLFCINLLSCVSNPSFYNKSVIDKANDKIAVLPFRDYNSVEGNNSGELIRSVFESRLMLRGYSVIEIEKITTNVDYSILKKQEFQSKWIADTGNKFGADYIIYGSVHDYRVYQNVTSFMYLFSWLEVTSSVGITARMVSCKTGEVVWSGSFTRSAYTFNDAATQIVDVLIRTIKLKKEIKE